MSPFPAFENRLCTAVESDAAAILTAVLTFDGARQWVFYTGDMDECAERLKNLPQAERPCEFEVTAAADPDWNYLRQDVLRVAPEK